MKIGISNHNVQWLRLQFSIIFGVFFISMAVVNWKLMSSPVFVLSGTLIIFSLILIYYMKALEKQMKCVILTENQLIIEGSKGATIDYKSIDKISVQKSNKDVLYITLIFKDNKLAISRLIDLNQLHNEFANRSNLFKIEYLKPKLLFIQNPYLVFGYTVFVAITFFVLMWILRQIAL